MDREKIKQRLIKEIESQFQKEKNKFRDTEGFDKLNAWSEKIGETPKFSEMIIDKLNEVLERENVSFKDDKEKNEFIEFMKPTVQNLIIRFIRN